MSRTLDDLCLSSDSVSQGAQKWSAVRFQLKKCSMEQLLRPDERRPTQMREGGDLRACMRGGCARQFVVVCGGGGGGGGGGGNSGAAASVTASGPQSAALPPWPLHQVLRLHHGDGAIDARSLFHRIIRIISIDRCGVFRENMKFRSIVRLFSRSRSTDASSSTSVVRRVPLCSEMS